MNKTSARVLQKLPNRLMTLLATGLLVIMSESLLGSVAQAENTTGQPKKISTIEDRIINRVYEDLQLDKAHYLLTVRRNSFAVGALDDIQVDSIRVRRLLTTEPKGMYPVVAYLYQADGSELHGQLTLYAQRFDSVVTLLRTATRGEFAEDAQVSVEFRDITKTIETPLKSVADLRGRQFRRNGRPGAIVTAEMIEKIPDIEPGDNVTINYRNGALTLSAAGKSLGRGVIGETVRVRNLSSHRVITATITAAGVVTPGAQQQRGLRGRQAS